MPSSSIKPGARLNYRKGFCVVSGPHLAQRQRPSLRQSPSNRKLALTATSNLQGHLPTSTQSTTKRMTLLCRFTDSMPGAFLRAGEVRFGLDDDDILHRQLAVKYLREDGEIYRNIPVRRNDAVRAALKRARAKHGQYAALVMIIDPETGDEVFVPAVMEENRQLAVKQPREDDRLYRSIRVCRHDAVMLALGRARAKYGEYAALVHMFNAETGEEAFVLAGSPEAASRKDDARGKEAPARLNLLGSSILGALLSSQLNP